MKSLWSQTVKLNNYKSQQSDLRAKNVVIGAGIAGILIAYFLQEQGQDVIVLEANEVASGQTKNTTAKITSQHGCIYHDMIKNCGMERAFGYARANEKAIQKYKEIITKEGINCHFEQLPSFLYSTEERSIEKLNREAESAKILGIRASFVEGSKITELPFPVKAAVRFENQAQFHPLEFIHGLAEKLTIYEHTKVLEVDERFVITEKGIVVADNVIFACHYPFPILPGYYFLRQHQSRSYALALEGEGVPKKLEGVYYSIDTQGLSFRSAEGRLILGGGSHRTGRKKKPTDKKQTNENRVRQNQKNFKETGFCYLREMTRQHYPKADETAHWAAQDCMPHDGIPFIGKYSLKKENWYVATGFQKWGMTTSMVAAMIISDMIIGNENPYAAVFSPQRLLIKAGTKNLLVDIWESMVGISSGWFAPKSRTCPHMGCALHWNEEEQSWDCACHGSRFDADGNILDDPAQGGLKK